MKNDFILYSLHTHVLPFTKTEAEVGDLLLKNGINPILLKPFNCTCKLPLIFSEINSNRKVFCKQCNSIESLLRLSLKGWKILNLSNWSCEDDFELADQEIKQINPAKIQDYYFSGIPVGKSAIHDVVLEFKIDDLNLYQRPDVWQMYVSLVRGSILCLLWFDRFLKEFEPNGLITYNSNYSLNRVISLDCDKRNLQRFSMHGGASLAAVWDTLMLTRGDIENYRMACVNNWQNSYHDRACSQNDVNKVSDHFKELLTGKKAHAYSSPVGSSSSSDLFKWIHKSNRKTILLSLSSSDERIAIESSGIRESHGSDKFVFPNQYDLIQFLIDKVKSNPNIQLIIRVHPREFPNKRENKLSSNAIKLKKKLSKLPENVLVNWPEDNVSYYDLIHHVDLVLSAWSTTLLEASLFGCPIVLPFNPTQYYDVVADAISHTPEEYWANILFYLDQDWTIERSIQTFRWYWMVQFGGSVSLESQKRRTFSFYEWILRGVAYFTKTISMGSELYSLPSNAFSGAFKLLLHRRINPRGAAAIVATLNSEIDPMEDFRELSNIQGLCNGLTAGPDAEQDERRAILLQLSEIIRIQMLDTNSCPKSKFLAMLERELRANNRHSDIDEFL